MNRKDIKTIVDNLSIEIDSIADEKVKTIQKTLLNLVEFLVAENDRLHEENQQLRDEISRLKGEQGKPKIRKQKKNNDDDENPSNHSSENERKRNKNNKPKKSKAKKNKINIDRQVFCDVDKSILPTDAQLNGYEYSVFQDIIVKTDNVEFKKAVYYSPSLKKTFMGPLPKGYYGEFGPGIRSWMLSLYNNSGVTGPALKELFETMGVHISAATISRMQTDKHDKFHQEKDDIIEAGMQSTSYQHIDDTSGRVNGKNHYVHILSNPYYTAYFTLPKKDRLTILQVLSRGELHFCFHEEAYLLMKEMGLSEKYLILLKKQKPTADLSREKVDAILSKLFRNPKKHHKNRRIILEASAIVAYRKRNDAISQLIADDAPQFKQIIENLGLCWVHEGRHYKKINPLAYTNRNILNNFIERFWEYYRSLLDYKDKPNIASAEKLSKQFDTLFSTKTGYPILDERIAKTLAKKTELLLVLKFPHIPLHNNSAEHGARFQARKRDIHLQTINVKGTKAKDTFATIVQTAKKLSVNIYDYFYDRITNQYQMPALAELIAARSQSVFVSS